jgi:hypothetical protein
VQPLTDLLAGLDRKQRVETLTKLKALVLSQIPTEAQIWVQEYAVGCSYMRAGAAVGKNAHNLRRKYLKQTRQKYSYVRYALQVVLAERAERSELTADFVREYIHNIMTFAPGDYFSPGPVGGWVITHEGYQTLPTFVRQLVEQMDIVVDPRTKLTLLSVKFISKTAALQLAAKYTLTQTLDVNVSSVPWDRVMEPVLDGGDQTVEERLEGMLARQDSA